MSSSFPSGGEALRFAQAELADVDTLLGLIAEYYAFDGISFSESGIRRALQELLMSTALGTAWLVHDGSVVAGYFIVTYGFDLEFGGRQATVTELFLRPLARRRGIGRRAFAHIEQHLERLGIEAYELQVERANAEARAFYSQLGFEAHDRIPLSKRLHAAAPER